MSAIQRNKPKFLAYPDRCLEVGPSIYQIHNQLLSQSALIPQTVANGWLLHWQFKDKDGGFNLQGEWSKATQLFALLHLVELKAWSALLKNKKQRERQRAVLCVTGLTQWLKMFLWGKILPLENQFWRLHCHCHWNLATLWLYQIPWQDVVWTPKW